MLKDNKLHSVRSVSRKPALGELNYDVFDMEMLAVIFSITKWRHFFKGAQHKTIIYSDHQNLTKFKSTVKLNRRQSHWAEEFATFDYDLYY